MDLSDCQPSRVLCFPVWLSKESPSGPGAGRGSCSDKGAVGTGWSLLCLPLVPALAPEMGLAQGAVSERQGHYLEKTEGTDRSEHQGPVGNSWHSSYSFCPLPCSSQARP